MKVEGPGFQLEIPGGHRSRAAVRKADAETCEPGTTAGSPKSIARRSGTIWNHIVPFLVTNSLAPNILNAAQSPPSNSGSTLTLRSHLPSPYRYGCSDHYTASLPTFNPSRDPLSIAATSATSPHPVSFIHGSTWTYANFSNRNPLRKRACIVATRTLSAPCRLSLHPPSLVTFRRW